MDENRRLIYEQDCEFYRHQDSLMWSRFQLASTVEAALLYVLYISDSAPLEKFLFAVVATVLAGLIFLAGLKDGADAEGHLNRIKQFEQASEIPFTRKRTALPNGALLMRFAIVILLISDIALTVYAGMHAGFSIPAYAGH